MVGLSSSLRRRPESSSWGLDSCFRRNDEFRVYSNRIGIMYVVDAVATGPALQGKAAVVGLTEGYRRSARGSPLWQCPRVRYQSPERRARSRLARSSARVTLSLRIYNPACAGEAPLRNPTRYNSVFCTLSAIVGAVADGIRLVPDFVTLPSLYVGEKGGFPKTSHLVPTNNIQRYVVCSVYVRSSNGYRIDGGGARDAGELGARNEY